MQFIKFWGTINDQAFLEANENRQESHRLTMDINSRTADLNQKLGEDGCFFVSAIDGNAITCGAIVKSGKMFKLNVNRFLNALKMDISDVTDVEVTFSSLGMMLSTAFRNDYINDDDEILEAFGLDVLNGRWGRSLDYGENVINCLSDEEIMNAAEKYLAEETLIPELKRISSVKVKPGQYGHPVLYFIETDDRDLRRHFCRMLIQSLYNAGRLDNRRYVFMDTNPEDDLSMRALEGLYNSSVGGTVIIRYNCKMTAEEDAYATPQRRIIEKLTSVARKYRNQVLTIFCLGRECNSIKSIFYENLENMTFIDLREDLAQGDQARNYLKMLAKDNNIRSDKALMAKVEPNGFYLSNQLQLMFDEWYDHKLRTKIFPGYKEAVSVKKKIQEEAPKGSAYDELMELIGIADAKAVMKQALDYYKARKLFKERGMNCESMPLHLCFTGNPGSCKTTAARLFTRILYENGIISDPCIHELTAVELKAKYVGHTAPLVKKKFAESRSGVLFLDEAYSLVDDRDGSFGDEALACIVAEMENHRDDVICIFAGYSDKMEGFLKKNPGMRSRIQFHVNFDDYSVEELCEISRLIAKKMKLKLTDGAVEKLRIIFAEAVKDPDFGNGRFARNLVEHARMKQCSRLVAMDYDRITDEDIMTITEEDIEEPRKKTETRSNVIGFCA